MICKIVDQHLDSAFKHLFKNKKRGSSVVLGELARLSESPDI